MDTPKNELAPPATKLAWERPVLRRMDAGAAGSTVNKRPHVTDGIKHMSS